MLYAAIAIPTLCRDEHLKRCVESLKVNSYARFTDVYIIVDYPSNDSHVSGYKRVCNYLDNGDFSIFRKFEVIKREYNYGAFKNLDMFIHESIIPRYDCWCIAEDDVVFSPCYLEYIDKCLTKYEDDPGVIAVTAYSYPCDYKVSEYANIMKEDFYISMWGTAFWRDKYVEIEDQIKEKYLNYSFEKNLKEKKYQNLIDARKLDFFNAGLNWDSNSLYSFVTDLSFTTFAGLNQLYVIYPVISKVKNIGFDGTGVTCPDDPDNRNAKQMIDEAREFDIIEDELLATDINKKIVNEYDSRKKSALIKSWFKVLLYLLMGRERYKQSWIKRNSDKVDNVF